MQIMYPSISTRNKHRYLHSASNMRQFETSIIVLVANLPVISLQQIHPPSGHSPSSRKSFSISRKVFKKINVRSGSKDLCMDVSENSGTPKSSLFVVFSIINHPFWGSPIFGNTHVGEGSRGSSC